MQPFPIWVTEHLLVKKTFTAFSRLHSLAGPATYDQVLLRETCYRLIYAQRKRQIQIWTQPTVYALLSFCLYFCTFLYSLVIWSKWSITTGNRWTVLLYYPLYSSTETGGRNNTGRTFWRETLQVNKKLQTSLWCYFAWTPGQTNANEKQLGGDWRGSWSVTKEKWRSYSPMRLKYVVFSSWCIF